MKKALLSLIALALCLTASAQKVPLKISMKAGVTFPRINTSKDAVAAGGSGISENKINTSFYFGATVDVSLYKNVLFQPGFTVTGNGTSATYVNYLPNAATSGKIRLTYLQIPLNFVTHIPLGKGQIFAGLGPYVAYALTGTARYTFVNNDNINPNKQNIEFGPNNDFKRLDMGGNLLAGYQLKNGLNIHGGLSAGARKISNSSDTYLKARNLVFSLGVGFAL